MKFTLNWLKEYLDTTASLEQICDRLVTLGHEVESITDRAKLYAGLQVAHVVECDRHPNADRLNLCLVNTGKEQIQVVCGAPNVKKGQKIVLALPGTIIPQSGEPLKKGTIRGVDSNGMICSEAELNLSTEANGILELPDNAPIGMDFAAYRGLNDPVIEMSITPNRADALGVYGLARDLAASGMGKLKTLPLQPVPGSYDSSIAVTIADKKACPLFMGRMIRGVKNGPSPKWLQDYLTAIGSKPISALVDITNYICLGLGRPLHVFDADKLAGNITVRRAHNGEKCVDLKEKEQILNSDVIAVCDDKGVQAMAGVIGGLHSACSSETTTIFLESALFDARMTRKTGKDFGIDSDAKYRFERGIDPAFCDEGIEIATRMILDLCGGEPSYTVVAGAEPNWLRTIPFDPRRTLMLGGIDIAVPEQLETLIKLGCQVRERPDGLIDVQPPSYRADIEGQADIVEEILRVKGYENIPAISVKPDLAVPVSALTPAQKRLSDLRRLCTVRGLSEAMTWSFMSEKAFEACHYADKKMLRLANPISQDLGIMRHSIVPHLLDAVARNADRKLGDAHLFEAGPVFFDTLPDTQPVVLTLIRSGQQMATNWQEKPQPVGFFTLKADVWALLQHAGLNPDNMPLTREAPKWYHPGQSATLRLGKTLLVQFGVLHPALLKEHGIDGPVAAAELFIDALPPLKDKKSSTKATLTLNPLHPVKRDFAFVVSHDVPAETIIKAIKNTDKNLITGVHVFDVYAGKGVAEGHRSLALSVTLQPKDKTLTDKDIEMLSQAIVTAVTKAGGQLRG